MAPTPGRFILENTSKQHTHTSLSAISKMLRSDDERERERGGEAPMEIDSPPPLWLKPPTSSCLMLLYFTLLYSAAL